jgi:hypothetical protein
MGFWLTVIDVPIKCALYYRQRLVIAKKIAVRSRKIYHFPRKQVILREKTCGFSKFALAQVQPFWRKCGNYPRTEGWQGKKITHPAGMASSGRNGFKNFAAVSTVNSLQICSKSSK